MRKIKKKNELQSPCSRPMVLKKDEKALPGEEKRGSQNAKWKGGIVL